MKDPNSQNSTSPKTKRRPLGKRISDGARAVGELGQDIVKQPGVLPGKAHGWFRNWFGRVWKVRGGGLYACGYAATFIFLEVRTIVSEVAESESIGQFFSEQLIEFFFRFFGETLSNMIHAFIWPVEIVTWWPPYGAIGLGLAFVAFNRFLRKPVEQFLQGDSGDSEAGV